MEAASPSGSAVLCGEAYSRKWESDHKGVISMEIRIIENILKSNPYPGRGIILGKSMDGQSAVIAYFIMGRSENSRNRVFVTDGDGIRTEAFDETKLVDPSLIIYAPVRVLNGTTIVTNGDQTDTVYACLKNEKTFASALRTRTFEPDEPNFTPRISGIIEALGNYKLSILKSACGDPASVQRYFFEYDSPISGCGHFIHTYQKDGNPLPSFEGEPVLVPICGSIDDFTAQIWNGLNDDNKVSLFTRFINLNTGMTDTRIVNKNQ
jgi:IMP cyclohydrolase